MIPISPIYATTIVQKIALYCSSYAGNDTYYLKEAVMLLVNLYGEERIIEMLKKDESPNKTLLRKIGEDWRKPKGMKKKLSKISKILEKINKSYSILEDKKIPKEKKETIKFQDFLKQTKEFPKIEMEFYALFVFLVDNCSVRQMNISPQFLKVLESGKTFGGVNKPRLRNESNNIQ